ncbi:Protein N-acetyltransferase, RimJ/RimL family [Shimia gijangensis]|uniref:Protein N-acetyltransferase, RimJ/RimL family n=1 Tax=Shimia gijangensis TaxID=1470563 RepID=A0A1M6KZG2_9RHOB|nr:GNAT family N-acetyltransferase [Shimia gijangensis]SHJ64373.1 Protein N-acetyltransferase, RimJ/RimL family [Shimia gijangensis]
MRLHPLSEAELTFETERLVLRPFTLEDIDLSRALLFDSEVMKYVGELPEDFDIYKSQHDVVRRGAGGRIGIWCVIEKTTGEKLGDVVLTPLPIELDDTDWASVVPDRYPDAEIETGYLLRRSAWGKGYATEACRRIVRFGFEMTDLDTIVAVTDPENTASMHVLQKCGLRQNGLRRAYRDDNCTDFTITREEWLAQNA